MPTRTIVATLWGRRGAAKSSALDEEIRVRVAEGSTNAEATASSLARRLGGGLEVLVRADGYTGDAAHFEATIVRPLPRRLGGGYSVEGSVWFAVPRVPVSP